MTFLPRLTLLVTLLAGSSLHAEPMYFTPCSDTAAPGSLCSGLTVPGRYDEQGRAIGDADAMHVFVRKFAADVPAGKPAKGTLWLVAGGPGESGAAFYSLLPTLRRSFPGFEFLIPDHRGTGHSSRLCKAEESEQSPGGRALAGAEWGSCFAGINLMPEYASQFSITMAARDLQALIEGERKAKSKQPPVYVYSVSYGTQLVLRTLQLGPLPVQGVIFDSLVPPQTDARWDLSQRSHVVNTVGMQVLALCDADAACHSALGEPAATLYRRVLDKMQADPALLAQIPGKNLKNFLGGMLDVPAPRARIPYLLQDLDRGGEAELASVRATLTDAAASLGSYPQSPLSIPLVNIISNSENNLQPSLRPGWTVADIARDEADLLFTSPLPRILLGGGLPTYPRDTYFGVLPEKMPPTLVLQGTLDPKTPYAGAQAQVRALTQSKAGKVALSSVQNAPHFILWTAPACFEQASTRFIAGKPAQDCTL
ncbi:Alpha/beta hydrolase family protein [Janthinobacterium sp. KBS0711]|uniref:alpha/beta fold hydrolase n=1 Tax=Janthinobacterium sp. KBS0711 TaxID=1649647 RepID=UPI000627825A|nr:alpha/beta fold hydrolase [Janthinobacterium sp. KBS0711]KKO62235.1 Alpha/beta hydrolase family protein [Janthinobacterium sp. KBS0711]TSD72213.1 alpha/beta hydrolase [Janthinobacterium sp. KBS0711]